MALGGQATAHGFLTGLHMALAICQVQVGVSRVGGEERPHARSSQKRVMGRISSLTWLSEDFPLLSLEDPTLINEAAVPLDASQTRPSQLNSGVGEKSDISLEEQKTMLPG